MAGKDIVVRYLLPLLESCLTDKKWRFKLAYSESIVALIRVLGYD